MNAHGSSVLVVLVLVASLGGCASSDAQDRPPPTRGAAAPATTPPREPASPASERSGAAPGRATQRIHIDVDDVDLTEVMDLIGRQVGRNILVDPTVQESVTVSLRDIPWREAVDVIARMCRCEVEERPGGILVLTQPA